MVPTVQKPRIRNCHISQDCLIWKKIATNTTKLFEIRTSKSLVFKCFRNSVFCITNSVLFNYNPILICSLSAVIQPLEIIIPDEASDALSKKCRETIFRYQQERNSLASIPVRLEEMPKSRIGVDEFQSALYQMNEETKDLKNREAVVTNSKTSSFSNEFGETIFCYQQEPDSVAANRCEKDEGVCKLGQLWPSFSLSLSR